AIVCSVVMFCPVTPSTSHLRSSPRPTSIVTTRWLGEIGSTAMLRMKPCVPAPPIGVRLSSHSTAGIIAMMATNQRMDVKAGDVILSVSVRAEVSKRPACSPGFDTSARAGGGSPATQPPHPLARRHDVRQADAELVVHHHHLALRDQVAVHQH